MANSRRRKHRAEPNPRKIHPKAGLTALASVVTVITAVVVTVGSVFVPSGATGADASLWPTQTVTATKTVTATVTATRTVWGPTATATVTKTVTGPSGSATTSVPSSTATTTRTSTPTYGTSSPTSSPTYGTKVPYVGAAIGNNGDPSSLEQSIGRHLGLHRTYWNYNKIDASVRQATIDAKAGRIPWLSYKLSVSWGSAATGGADSATKALAKKLSTVPGQVWVAIHHEPEGDGNLSNWVAMQKRLLYLLHAAPNVRTTIILTGWDTFFSGKTAYSLNSLWPGNMVDIMGFDIYNRYGDANHYNSGWSEMDQYYDKIAPAAKARGADWAIAETGYTDSAAAKDSYWLTRAFNDMYNRSDQPGIGLCYFDSSANSIGSWPLTGVKTTRFKEIVNRSRS